MKTRTIVALAVLGVFAAAALAQTITAYSWITPPKPTTEASVRATFQNAISAGLVATIDNASITNPATQITRSGTSIVRSDSGGTFLVVRLAYDDGLTGITNPIVKVFGRASLSEPWRLLRNRAGSLSASLATASTDATDGTLDYTTPDLSTNVWDVQGCDQFIIGVETALAGTGTTSNATVQVLFQ
jgi:hypothetical protein